MMRDKLNILQITTHDSVRHFGYYGHPTVQTPAIDQLAVEGMLFTNCFCRVPACSDSQRVSPASSSHPGPIATLRGGGGLAEVM